MPRADSSTLSGANPAPSPNRHAIMPPESHRPPVGVVIVNHNLKDSLRETLLSFRKVNYPGLQIVVSDNASSDGATDMVRSEFPEVHLLAHQEEQGYARAASLGMDFLVNRGCKYIF